MSKCLRRRVCFKTTKHEIGFPTFFRRENRDMGCCPSKPAVEGAPAAVQARLGLPSVPQEQRVELEPKRSEPEPEVVAYYASLTGLFPADIKVQTLDAATSALPLSKTLLGKARAQASLLRRSHPSLSTDECAAIILFATVTLDEASPRQQMNAELSKHHGRIEAVRPWRDYIYLLLHALQKLPPASASMVFQGSAKAPGAGLTPGSTFKLPGFTSTATIEHVARASAGADLRVLLKLELTQPLTARNIRSFAVDATEDEIVLPPDTEFEVLALDTSTDELVIVHCCQIESIDQYALHSLPPL